MERYDLMGTPYASGDRAGILRTANAVDEKNSGCTDAAITPSNLHNVLGCRKANTAYTGNEIVACPYQPGLLLKCVQAGTTSTNPLDTTSVTKGQVITDGGVKWLVYNPLDDYLPLSGGVMTGGITTSGDIIVNSRDDFYVNLSGGSSYNTGANLTLYGNNHNVYAGQFVLSTGQQALIGDNDGNLSWLGARIPLFVNGMRANEDGNITVNETAYSLEGGYGYIVFHFGAVKLVLQWAQYVLPATKGASARFYIAYPISYYLCGGVNALATNQMKVEHDTGVDNMVSVYKGADDVFERYGDFWVLGVAK